MGLLSVPVSPVISKVASVRYTGFVPEGILVYQLEGGVRVLDPKLKLPPVGVVGVDVARL